MSVIADTLKMGKNIILAHYFNQFSREEVLGGGAEGRGSPLYDGTLHRLMAPESPPTGPAWLRGRVLALPAAAGQRSSVRRAFGARRGSASFCAWRLAAA